MLKLAPDKRIAFYHGCQLLPVVEGWGVNIGSLLVTGHVLVRAIAQRPDLWADFLILRGECTVSRYNLKVFMKQATVALRTSKTDCFNDQNVVCIV